MSLFQVAAAVGMDAHLHGMNVGTHPAAGCIPHSQVLAAAIQDVGGACMAAAAPPGPLCSQSMCARLVTVLYDMWPLRQPNPVPGLDRSRAWS